MDIDWGDDEVPGTPEREARIITDQELLDLENELRRRAEQENEPPLHAGSPEEEEEEEDSDQAALKLPRHGRLKRFKTLSDRERERELTLQRLEQEYGLMRPESGSSSVQDDPDRPAPHNFPGLLRSEQGGNLPQPFVNDVWMRVLEEGVGDLTPDGQDTLPEKSVFDIETMAAGLAPDQPLPQNPRIDELNNLMADLFSPEGVVKFPPLSRLATMELLPGEEGLAITSVLQRRVEMYRKERDALQDARTDEAYRLRRRQGMAGIPELARVLSTCNPLWRRWWHRDFPRQVLEYGSLTWSQEHVNVPAHLHDSRNAPRPPRWILGMRARENLSEAHAGVEAQYAECAWRRFYVWTQFFERRCYRLVMDIEEARATEYRVERPRYTPHGVYWAEPMRPDSWRLQSAEAKSMDEPGTGYVAFAHYNNGADDNDDIDREIDLDAVAQLIPENERTLPAPLSAALQAYVALRHAGDNEEIHEMLTLDAPCRNFAALALAGPRRIRFLYNFIDDDDEEALLNPDNERQDLYCNILLSYILWSAVTAERREREGGPAIFGETIESARQRALVFRLPIPRELLDPLEQATMLNFYVPSGREDEGIEGSWPFLEALPVVPMRGVWRSTSRIHGEGGIRFVGQPIASKQMIV